MLYTIYKALSPSNKVYIGITKKTLDVRKKEHISLAKSEYLRPFYSALRKYKEDMLWSVIETVDSLELAEEKEKYYINLYKSTDRNYGYNLSPGGSAGSIMSDEGKKRRLEKMKKYYEDPEYVKKITKHLINRKETDVDYYKKQKQYIDNYFSKEENRRKHSELSKKHNQDRDFRIYRCKLKGGKPFKCNETGEVFLLLQDAADRFGVDKRNIHSVLKYPKRNKTILRKYTFSYLTKEEGG